MKLSTWARQKGITYLTAYRMYRNGLLSNTEQLPTGTILINEDIPVKPKVVLYARVSSHDQKSDLVRQVQRLRDYAAQQGFLVHHEITEVGSGLNGHRNKLIKVLSDLTITHIIVEHRDRLARFGVEYLEACLSATKRQLVVLNQSECKDDLVQDFIDLATSMCARIYGRRSAANKAKRIVEVIQTNEGD